MKIAHYKPDNGEEKSKMDNLINSNHQDLAQSGLNEQLEAFLGIGRQDINITVDIGGLLDGLSHFRRTANPFGPIVNWKISVLEEMGDKKNGDAC